MIRTGWNGIGRYDWLAGGLRLASPKSRFRGRFSVPSLERLERRELLSFYTGPSANRPVLASGGAFLVQVEGSGVVKVHPAGHGAIDLVAFGTDTGSTITITQARPLWHYANRPLAIHKLVIVSGQLGSLEAAPAELTGKMSTLSQPMNTLELGALGPAAQVDVSGGVDTFEVTTVNLGPTGQVALTQGAGNSGASESFTVGTMNLDGGQFAIGGDADAALSIQGNLTASHDGELSVGRDIVGGLTVGGSVELATGGQISIGRNVSELVINGNLIVNPASPGVPSGAGISVGGELSNFVVGGYFQGQGGTATPTAFDLGVGLDVTGLAIQGGISGVGGLINANIRAGGTINSENIPYGIVNSTIQPNTPPPT
ncbi:MAG: hypothetical protein ACLQIB_35920 [Isosphaeraceae bacterium]